MAKLSDRTYNVYVKIINMAILNMKNEMCRINMIKPQGVSIKVTDRERILDIVSEIMRHPKGAIQMYADDVESCVIIRCFDPDAKMTSASAIFIDSILNSREARVAQKKLVELLTGRYNG